MQVYLLINENDSKELLIEKSTCMLNSWYLAITFNEL